MDYNSSLSQFIEIWNQIASNASNRRLENAMRDWCEKLSIETTFKYETDQFIKDIYQWLQNEPILEASFKIYGILLKRTNDRLMKMVAPVAQSVFLDRVGKNNFKNNCQDSLKEMENTTMNKLVALVAFVLVGVGIGLYLSNQNKASSNRKSTITPKPEEKALVLEEKVLVLVVNAQSEKVLNSIKQNKKITADDCESLGRATKYLWMGNKNDFSQSELKKWVDASPVPENEETEYDVCLVQINLNEYERGFEPNAINRLPAFRRLPDIAGEVKVSHRLPVKAYENASLYRLT